MWRKPEVLRGFSESKFDFDRNPNVMDYGPARPVFHQQSRLINSNEWLAATVGSLLKS
jgi:hypothetical protein